nr:hypothetical protein [uncultured Macellibacteroides sp.]
MKTIIKEKLNKLAQLKYLSRWVVFSADLATSIVLSLFTILFLRYAISINADLAMFVRMGIFSCAASILSFMLFHPYKGVVRHSTLQELWRIGSAALLKALLLLTAIYLWGSPKTIKFWMKCFFIDALTTNGLLVTLRVILINVYNFILNNTGKVMSIGGLLLYYVEDKLQLTALLSKVNETVMQMKAIVSEFISQNSIFEQFDVKEPAKARIRKLVI